jgi:ribosomal protein S15P/S13E
MNAFSLYALSSEVERLLNGDDAFDPETGELSPALVDALGATKEKGVSVAAYVLNLDSEIVAIQDHMTRVARRLDQIENRRANLHAYLRDNMKRTGITEIKAHDASFVAKLYIDRDKSVEIFDEKQIPAKFMRLPDPPVAKPNKTEIGKAIKAGEDVPGAVIRKKDRLVIG